MVFGDDGVEVGAFVVAVAGLAGVEDGAGGALRLVAHLQHAQLGVVEGAAGGGVVGTLANAAKGEDEVGDVRPMGAAADGVLVDLLEVVAAGDLVELAGVGNDDDPHAMLSSPELEGGDMRLMPMVSFSRLPTFRSR